MKILYILKQAPDRTLSNLIERQKDGNEVSIIHIDEVDDYGAVVDQIAETDKVIAW